MGFERVGGETVWQGRIAAVHVDRFRHEDGEEAEREYVSLPGAVGIVAHDGERLYMVAQPREAVDEQRMLELPAGKLDVEGEPPLETAKRELAEEVGKGARTWEHLTTYWASPGFIREEVHVYLATDLYEAQADSGENERIEIVEVPLDRLDDLIAESSDAKTLIGLLWFRAHGSAASAR